MKKADLQKIKKEFAKIFDEISDFSEIPDNFSEIEGVMDCGHVCALYMKNKDFKKWFCVNFDSTSDCKNFTGNWIENAEPKKVIETKINTRYLAPIFNIAEILGEHVNIKISDDAPLILEIEGYFEYMIAPQIRGKKGEE